VEIPVDGKEGISQEVGEISESEVVIDKAFSGVGFEYINAVTHRTFYRI